MKTTVQSILKFLRRQDPIDWETDATRDGCTLRRGFRNSERYVVDFAPDFGPDGWEQFDTDQDAAYFGLWVNRRQRLTLCYCEGDWTLVECPDDTRYFAEVRRMIEYYAEGQIATVVDSDRQATVYCQDRNAFLESDVE